MARIVSFFVIFFTSVVVAYFLYFKPEEDLPIYQPSQLNPALVDASAMRAEDHRILDFELVNHVGDTVTLADVQGQILVVDFFFSRCATICPLMTKNLQRIHDRLDPQMPVRILSHSVTPQADSVSVLNRYAEKHGSQSGLVVVPHRGEKGNLPARTQVVFLVFGRGRWWIPGLRAHREHRAGR